jgi:hypothetical protein
MRRLRLSDLRTKSSLDDVNDPRSQRPGRKSAQRAVATTHPIGTPNKGISPNTGPLASAAWLVTRGLSSQEPRWYVEVTIGTAGASLDVESVTLLRLELYSEEWGFWFRHDDKISWIRVTDVPFVHGRDDHALLGETPPLKHLGRIVRVLENRFAVRFDVERASIRTSLFGAEPAIREWFQDW